MSKFNDPAFLRQTQYRDASNLSARIRVHKQFSANPYGLYRWIFDHFPRQSGLRILEIGCGPGLLWVENRDRLADDWRITLSDFSPGMVQQAMANLDPKPRQMRFCILDAQRIPFADASFDALIANFMLYHVPDRAAAIRELARVLRPGGRLFAATIGKNHLLEMREMLSQIDPQVEFGRAAQWFGLENGADQLRPYFTDIVVHCYDDALVVTEVEPLVEYILSSQHATAAAEHPDRLRREIRRRIERDRAFYIQKDVGMFEAVRRRIEPEVDLRRARRLRKKTEPHPTSDDEFDAAKDAGRP
ncbi:MAG: class I SAM-dependent methyltransferase [Chloroflexi bacterium]|nr:class I SAM-dependent methyltransferase [Chloroflexota bacterium]